MKTADQLNAEGKRRAALGHFIIHLYPSQEWMAVRLQVPFLRYSKL